MRKPWRSWTTLPFEQKLGLLIAPVLVALVAGVGVPRINDQLTSDPPPATRDARLEHLEVQTGITAAEYAARGQTVSLTPSGGGRIVPVVALAQTGSSPVPPTTTTVPPPITPPITPPTTTTTPQDADGDGFADGTDDCPQEAGTDHGCPVRTPAPDRDGDGVPDRSDRCPSERGTRADGCPENASPIDRDTDRDGARDVDDNCPGAPNHDQGDADGDGQGDLCEPPRVQALIVRDDYDLGCTDAAIDKALKDDASACDPVRAVAGAGATGTRARKILTVLRASRTSRGSGAKAEPLGITVQYEVTLIGFVGRRADVTWSLYRAHGDGQVPSPWLKNHRVLPLKGEVNTDPGSHTFWVPLPKRHGPYFVKLTVVDQDGDTLRTKNTKRFD